MKISERTVISLLPIRISGMRQFQPEREKEYGLFDHRKLLLGKSSWQIKFKETFESFVFVFQNIRSVLYCHAVIMVTLAT